MARGTSHRTKSFDFRRSSVAISLLALVLQVSSAGHLLLVEHVQCAEHGDLIHGSAHHDDGLRSPLIEAHAVRPIGDSDPNADHEHCAIAVERKDAVVLQLPTELSDAPRMTEAPAAPVSILAVRSGPLRFRVAPKNSPPV